MSVKGENSAFFGKHKFDMTSLKNFNFEIPRTPEIEFPDFSDQIISHEELTERQIEKQNEILDFLKTVTIEQSKTSKRQYFANLFLTVMTIVIGIIALVPVFTDQNKSQDKILNQQITELEREKLKQDLTTSELSKNLLELQNQVKILDAKLSKKTD